MILIKKKVEGISLKQFNVLKEDLQRAVLTKQRPNTPDITMGFSSNFIPIKGSSKGIGYFSYSEMLNEWFNAVLKGYGLRPFSYA